MPVEVTSTDTYPVPTCTAPPGCKFIAVVALRGGWIRTGVGATINEATFTCFPAQNGVDGDYEVAVFSARQSTFVGGSGHFHDSLNPHGVGVHVRLPLLGRCAVRASGAVVQSLGWIPTPIQAFSDSAHGIWA